MRSRSDPQYTGEAEISDGGEELPEEKGYDIAVQITAELKKRGLRFKWFIIGDGRDLNKLRTMAKEYQVEQGNYFSRNARKSCAVRKKSCDLYLQPSVTKAIRLRL